MCRSLTPAELSEINRISTRKRLPAGAQILHEDESPDWCAVIISGAVKLVKNTMDGREQIVAIQFPADFIGQPFSCPSRLRAEAATTVELCTFPRAMLDGLVKQHPNLGRTLLEDTSEALDDAREWMLVLGRKSAEEKVASFLLLMLERSAEAGCGLVAKEPSPSFDLPLSRTEMGHFLGLRIETVSRQLRALKTAGVIRTIGTRRVKVLDPDKLKYMSERDTAEA
jgi:CRP/FNR family transcriptional regulator